VLVISEKFMQLRMGLQRWPAVGVAFSGGVDSTVLLHNCCQVFNKDQVTALHASSCLHSARAAETTRGVCVTHFIDGCTLINVECDPLGWPEFVRCGEKRCYHCKARTFGLLLKALADRGVSVLLDGTNVDDLSQDRPGLQAARELGVQSPFVEYGIGKNDIRKYARENGLINHDLPSNSCLATRVDTQHELQLEDFISIERGEEFLLSLGLVGSRVRPRKGYVLIELQKMDIERVVQADIRWKIIDYFSSCGMGQVFLGLQGR
jgi:pyridinium-3,5-biscarboxylic acid mononucleotide sulfurtransferase